MSRVSWCRGQDEGSGAGSRGCGGEAGSRGFGEVGQGGLEEIQP